MLITRSPLRISLGGGGTDLPSYYEHFGGFLIAAAIDRYVYVTVNRPFGAGIRLKYSNIENCDTVDEIQHPILRAAHAADRDHHPGRDSVGYRSGVVRQFYDCAGQGAVCAPPPSPALERGGPAGLRD